MYKILGFILFGAMCLLPIIVIAQPDITVTDHRNFSLDAYKEDGGIYKTEMHLTAVYASKDKSYSISKFGETNLLFKISEPLNRVEFQNQLVINWSKIDSKVKGFTNYSFEQIILWLYGLSQQDGNRHIGTLFLGRLTQVFKNGFVAKNNPARVLMLQNNGNEYLRLVTRINALRAKDTSAILSYLAFAREKKVTVPDTAFVKELLDRFASQEVPSLTNAEREKLVAATPPEIDLNKATKKVDQARTTLTDLDRTLTDKKELLQDATLLLAGLTDRRRATAIPDSTIAKARRMKESLETEITELTRKQAQAKTALETAEKEKEKMVLMKEIVDTNPMLNFEVFRAQSKVFDQLKNHYKEYNELSELLISVKRTMITNNIYPIEKISLQFERGHIERIQVWVKNAAGEVDIYENIYAIGFSSINNLKAFQSLRLFIRKSERSDFRSCIYLSDALGNYDNVVDLYTRDYSPADTAINEITPDKPVLLDKEKNIRLFESKIFSDLQGIEGDAPNGLVQIEVARKFNLNTYRWQVGTTRLDVGWVSYLNLYGSLNKIENKLKRLPLRNENVIENGIIVSPAYASNLDIRRYENASLGIDVNGFLLDWPDMKMTLFTNLGMRYGHVPTTDTINEVSNGVAVKTGRPIDGSGNTVTFTIPKLTLEFFSERRVGFTLSYNYNIAYLFSNNGFKQVMSYAKSDLTRTNTEKAARKYHMAEVFVRIETNRDGNGQLFLRSRFFWQQGDANTFFPQIQVGYNYNILFRK